MSVPGQVTGFETGVCERIITAKYQPVPTTVDVNNIYVNSATGSDNWPGTGDSSNPYATIARAIKDTGNLGLLDVQRIVLLDAGPHELPEGYVLPGMNYSDRETEGAAFLGFTERAPLVITSEPQEELAIPVLNIIAQNLQATSNLLTVQTDLALTPGAFAGLWVVDSLGVMAAIHNNDATDLDIAHSGALTGPLTVYSRLASIVPENPAAATPTLHARSGALLLLLGVEVQETTRGGLKVDSGAKVHAVACNFESVFVGDDDGSPGFFVGEACRFKDFTGSAGQGDLYRSSQVTGDVSGVPGFVGIARESIFETCATPVFATAAKSASSATVRNCELRDATARGLFCLGTYLEATDTLIEGANTAGVQVAGNGSAVLDNVNGANSTNGLVCQSGGKAIITSDTAIAGAASADFVVEGVIASSAANFRAGTAPFSLKGPGGSAIIQGADTGNARRKATLTTTTPYNLTGADDVVGVDATAGAKVVNLPDLAANRGRTFTAQKTDVGGNTVTLTAAGADTIGGSGVLAAQYDSITVIAPDTGTVWLIIADNR